MSTQRQAQAQTVEQQIERLTGHARQQGWDVLPDQVFRDDGYSGASLRRPGLDRLRDRAAARNLDLVVITISDRLARNYVHQVLLLEELQGHGYGNRYQTMRNGTLSWHGQVHGGEKSTCLPGPRTSSLGTMYKTARQLQSGVCF